MQIAKVATKKHNTAGKKNKQNKSRQKTLTKNKTQTK
jgi:hypothetical protein